MIAQGEVDALAGSDTPESELTGRMPDFMIIGAMKSGTTSLYHLLRSHPQVFLPKWKEPQYFSREHMYSLGEQFYRDIFREAKDEQLIGEASTCYSRWPHYPDVVGRIAERLPTLRLIYIMRHPVERAYSHYGHIMQERMLKKSGPIVSFEEALEQEPEIVDTSLYLMQINKYLEVFSREQILCLTFDELKEAPNELLKRIQRFLGIEEMELKRLQSTKSNQWGDKVATSRVRRVVSRLEQVQGLQKLASVIPREKRKQLRDSLVRSNFLNSLFKVGIQKKKKDLSPLTPEMREKLIERFKKPTQDLEEFLGQKIENWHK
jgi:hypothetical protein